MTPNNPSYCLLLVCPDRKGIVAAVAGFLAERDASISEAKQFNDQLTSRFYMRAVFTAAGPAFPRWTRCAPTSTRWRVGTT